MIFAAVLAVSLSAAPVVHMTYQGIDRTFHVYRPEGLSKERAVPLVVMLHGGFGSGAQAERAYHWDESAQKYGFVVLYPDGVNHAWNAGTCCGTPAREGIDDVGFLSQLIALIEAGEHIDPDRVVVAGMSNGAMMAYRMACDAPIQLYGIASVAGTMMTPCPNAKPTNVIEIHGDADKNVPYNGGKGSGPAGVVALPVQTVIARWSSIDGCHHAMPFATAQYSIKTYGCDNKRSVSLVTVNGAGHQWPGGPHTPAVALDATDFIVHAMQLASP